MQKVILVVVGLGLLGFGGYRQLMGGGVDAAAQARCEEQVRARQGTSTDGLDTLLAACNEPGMVAMMEAQTAGDNAQAAGARIAAANQSDFSAHLLDWAMIGGGLVLVAAGAMAGRRRA